MKYHLAAKINDHGHVSALCYPTPRPIPLKRGHSWVLDVDRVTCEKCRRLAADAGITSALIGPTPTPEAGDAHG